IGSPRISSAGTGDFMSIRRGQPPEKPEEDQAGIDTVPGTGIPFLTTGAFKKKTIASGSPNSARGRFNYESSAFHRRGGLRPGRGHGCYGASGVVHPAVLLGRQSGRVRPAAL